ncbi:ribonuclease H-like domain-containing protein [Chaetomidium leptoderma]|uniref:Ribonuclease H-like domain-containing protein n=1 Tax=Chaetomidium leptoderma TaxID=669021 RepID=A0AAN6VQC9_9PEZI|nr:ribonuclease H-like domain-containing protein [Chaetomidium leptoderma]
MSTRKTAHQVWHVSRGIVFAGGSSVVYPRLPPVRHHSAPAAVAVASEAALGDVVTTLATTPATVATTVSAISTTVLVDGAAKEDQVPLQGAVDESKPKDAESTPKDAGSEPKPKDPEPQLPPFTPLDFKIPDKAFQEAKQAPEETLKSFFNYNLYRGPGDDGAPDAKVKVHYCTSSRTTEKVIQKYFMKEKILGFDLEWMSNVPKDAGPRKNVSLVQLASPSRIGLFHIAAYPRKDTLVAPSLKKLMEDPGVTKLGVAVKGDCKRMSEHLDVKPRGQFELSHLYKLVKHSESGEYGLINKRLVALATQVNECLGLPMFKGSDVRTSDWTRPLKMDQIIYSSSDAYAAVQLYAVLDHQRKSLDTVPAVPHHAELNLPIPVAKPPPPVVTEEQDPETDEAVDSKSAVEGKGVKSVPDDEAILEDTLVREDGPAPATAPEDEPVHDDDKPVRADSGTSQPT